MSNAIYDSWDFIYDTPTDDFPKGYYLHKPTGKKYCFSRGIQDLVSVEDEQYIYDTWWVENG